MLASFQLIAFVLQMVFLAVCLSFMGWAVNRLINAVLASRADPSLKRLNRIESARLRSSSRSAARAH